MDASDRTPVQPSATPSLRFASTAPARLDAWLAEHVQTLSRSRWQELIREERVLVNGAPRKPNYQLHAGDLIAWTLPEPRSVDLLPEAIPLEILFEDDDLIALNKQAGLVVHPAPGHDAGTLVNALLHHVKDLSGVGGESRPGIVHRLDKGTSGVMVVAKHDQAHRELSRQFHDREVEKEYVALVWGLVQQRRRINASIGRDPKHRQRMSTRATRARDAVTRVTWARDLEGLTLLRVAIATGRTHQIRVHLSAIGHPVVGDALYGGVHRRVPHRFRAVQRLTRPFLHAERLAFTHPRTGERLTFTAPLPADLEDVLMAVTPEDMRSSLFAEESADHETNRDDE